MSSHPHPHHPLPHEEGGLPSSSSSSEQVPEKNKKKSKSEPVDPGKLMKLNVFGATFSTEEILVSTEEDSFPELKEGDTVQIHDPEDPLANPWLLLQVYDVTYLKNKNLSN